MNTIIEVEILENTRLDQVVYEFYENLGMFERILELNDHLTEKLFLEEGDRVKLIKIEEQTKILRANTLW